MELTYLGHSSFLLEADGVRLLIDPWLDGNPSATCAPGDLTDLDAVLVTHAAFDHLGDAPDIARRTGADLLCDFATSTSLERKGFPEDQLHPYVWGPVHEGDGWSAKVVEARHVSMIADEGLTAVPLGYIVSVGGERVYHMGDTSIFGDVELFADLYEPTVGLIPVGMAPGYFTELYPDEAALVAEWLDADVVVPMHYVPGSSKPAEFEEQCADRNVGSRVERMDPGATLSL